MLRNRRTAGAIDEVGERMTAVSVRDIERCVCCAGFGLVQLCRPPAPNSDVHGMWMLHRAGSAAARYTFKPKTSTE
jgi:hypothetical protein